LTVAIKTAANADATSGTPILIPFRDATLANGDPVIGSLQSALSFTVASTNTMGASSGNVAFRLWVIAYYNGGTLAVGLFNASTATQVFGLSEGDLVSTAASTNGGSSAGTHYANVSTITNTPFRILGYLEWGSGLATAGTWASGPTSIVLFGPGVKKPGETVQGPVVGLRGSATSSSSASFVTSNIAASITPKSPVNLIVGTFSADCMPTSGTSQTLTFQPTRGSTQIGLSQTVTSTASTTITTCAGVFFDAPNTAASTTYAPFFKVNTGNTANFPASGGTILLWEIMGSLDEPANDNINSGIFSRADTLRSSHCRHSA
jgi:hypothetical protein